MKIPYRPGTATNVPQQRTPYLEGGAPAAAFGVGVASALAGAGATLQDAAAAWHERQKKTERFDTLKRFDEFQTQVTENLTNLKRGSDPAATNYVQQAEDQYSKMETDFLATVPHNLKDEFTYRAGQVKQRTVLDSLDFQYKQQDSFYRTELDKAYNTARNGIDQDPSTFDQWSASLAEKINASDLPETEKVNIARNMQAGLAAVSYGKAYEQNQLATLTHTGGWIGALKNKESSGNPAVMNQFGYAGFYQFGAPRLAFLGVYSPGSDENLNSWSKTGENAHGKWSGTFHIPGFPGVQNIEDFLTNPAAQEKVFSLHVAKMDKAIAERGLDKYIGQQIGGTIITRPGLYSMIHLGGEAGTEEALRSGNAASDANGTNLFDYAKLAYQSDDVIDQNPLYAQIPYETRLALQNDAQRSVDRQMNEQDRQNKAVYDEKYNTLLKALSDGSLGQAALDNWKENNPNASYQDISHAQTVLDKSNLDVKLAAEGQTKLASGGVFDPTNTDDKKRLNAMVGKQGLQSIVDLNQDAFTNSIVPLVRGAHDIPTHVVGTLQGMVRSNNPQRALFALDALSQLQAADPRAYAMRVPEKLASDVDLWNARKDYYPPEELLNSINDNLDPQQRAARKQLGEDAKKELAKIDIPSVVENNYDGIFGFGNPQLSNVPWASKAVEQDFSNIFTEEYQRYADTSAATEATLKRMDRLWGNTSVGGNKTLMKYPPEKVGYQEFNGSYDWITDEVKGELAKLGYDNDTFDLISDEQTRAEAEAFQSGKSEIAPSYRIAVKHNGAYEVPMVNGQPLRMNFKVTTEMEQAQENAYRAKYDLLRFREFKQTYEQAMQKRLFDGTPIPEELEQQKEYWNKRF